MNVAVCLACGTLLHSKHRHDYVVCPCPNKAMLDGGDDYCRAGATDPRLHKGCKTMAEAKRLSALTLERNYKLAVNRLEFKHIQATGELVTLDKIGYAADVKKNPKVTRRDILDELTPLQKAELLDLAKADDGEWTTIRGVVMLHACEALHHTHLVELSLDTAVDAPPVIQGSVRILPKVRKLAAKLSKKKATK